MSANAYPANPLDTEPYGGSELVPRARARGAWDGVVLPYVPAPFGGDVAGLPLSREYDTDIDPVSYQVLRWRLWNINLEPLLRETVDGVDAADTGADHDDVVVGLAVGHCAASGVPSQKAEPPERYSALSSGPMPTGTRTRPSRSSNARATPAGVHRPSVLSTGSSTTG